MQNLPNKVINLNKKVRASSALSAFIAALIIFSIVILILNMLVYPIHATVPLTLLASDKELDLIGKPGSWWLAKAYFSKPTPPEVVIFGSSQLGAMQGADAYVYHKTIDYTGDHRSYVIEHNFQELLNLNWRVLVAALPGAMMSDRLIISRSLFSASPRPMLVIVTCSPRDFIDKRCPSPTSTEPFAFFFSHIVLSSKEEHVLFANNGFEWRKILCLLLPVREFLESKYPEVYKYFYEPSSKNSDQKKFAKPFERIRRGEVLMTPNDGFISYNNINDYRIRYRDPFSSQFQMQMGCFDALLAYLSQMNIKVLVIDMPLTNDNRKLLPASFWQTYTDQIIKTCRKYGAEFLDINNDWKAFGDEDFIDSVHLNPPGGLKLTRPISLFGANALHLHSFEQLRKDEHKMF